MEKTAITDPSLSITTASGLATWWAMASDIALSAFGVPLQVVTAAATGSFAVQSFIPSTGYVQSMVSGLSWTMFGIFGSNIGVFLVAKWLDAPPHDGLTAGMAFIIAAVGRGLITKEVIEKTRKAVGRFIDSKWSNK